MSWQALLTLGVIVGSLAVMMSNVVAPHVVLLSGVVLLMLTGVITPAEGLSGFSNTGMLTVAALFVVAAGLRETGAIGLATGRLLGRPKGASGAVARLVGPVIVASAFLNNTTIVASLLPAVHDWGRRIGVPASKLLIPLSFASILGGVCTLIGTSTNLVVSGLVNDAAPGHPGLHEIGMFEVSLLGVPIALIGGLVLTVLGPRLLPDRRPAVGLDDDPRRYTMELLVPAGSRLAGRTIDEAGLRHLPGAFLMEIVRGDHVIAAVGHEERLEGGDRLIFVGDVDAMVDLQRLPGLAAAPDQVFQLEGARHERVLVEAVVSGRSPVLGLSIRDARFRARYQAVVIGVARAGERLPGRIGDIVLHAGDTLLLEAHPDFVAHQRTRTDFFLVSAVDGGRPPRTERAFGALVVLAVLVGAITFDLIPTVVAAFMAAGAMLAMRCLTLEEAHAAVNLQVLVAIAAAFGLGHAMETTGVDAAIVGLAIHAGASSPWVALVVVYLITVTVTELVTNNAAAVLAFPLALTIAESLGVSPMPFVFAVMMAASASFLTPIGYQTNLMVYGPGGYRATDFIRVGLPLTVVCAITTLALAPVIWPF